MHARTRYLLVFLLVAIVIHLVLLNSHQGYSDAAAAQKQRIADAVAYKPVPARPASTPAPNAERIGQEADFNASRAAFLDRKANAALVMLAREVDLEGVISTMKQVEDRFNRKFKYPWVFLNERPFSDRFIKWTSEMTDAPIEYGIIPREHWNQPPWINETRAAETRERMKKQEIIYGGSIAYRNMCRYNSGFFFRHPLLQKYRYYWRVEPGVKFYCDLQFDPFLFMQDHNKVYGFTMALLEYEYTIPGLWASVRRFMKKYPQYIAKDNALRFISGDRGWTYNLCHFWSNFEIADMEFWRSEPYMKFFEHLDRNGGFYYERWGDAPVHSIGVALLANKDQIHFFDEIGYRHEPFEHCPSGEAHARGKCWCSVDETFDSMWYSCMREFERVY
ncbi:putative mannosyltransferase [Exidia glandulosa HHB12029]|uniref:Putative mannosyltransferase n=1 Tax=Exidia glandulosa HHB12029 TaxID=1314781 RepID=A0A165BCA6_EXIGL|nr:putative mannosyltransferase [Exidia glandulosa HHB12029]